MPHDHDQAHPRAEVPDLDPAFRRAVGLNVAYVLIEGAAGFVTGSLALLADAAHNLTDVAGLLIAWGAAALARRAGTRRHTFGYGRATILAAMVNAIAILIGVVLVIWEAVQRFAAPVEVPGLTVLLVALVGIGVNAGSARLFMAAQGHDLNARGAFVHMAADAAVSGAVVLAAGGILWTGWLWLDPLVAVAVSLLIARTAWSLFSESLRLGLDGVPAGVDSQAVAAFIAAQPGVRDVHDLHVWALSTTRTALAAHVVWDGADADVFLNRLSEALQRRFGIGHVTLQLEGTPCSAATACRLP
ncbi:MAG: cation diffusion facilitator family transporter [Roseovarius sp.]